MADEAFPSSVEKVWFPGRVPAQELLRPSLLRLGFQRVGADLAAGDKRLKVINAAAEAHARAGLSAVTGEHYEGGHWLGSFAVYLVSSRGIRATHAPE